ncbi:hypothetical protein CNMCM7691_006626 [Aspergillus felis]|uniref:Uncharacterized protein n=1 Tax=Aspergillus felis TaxID=1287682 RepID=A0A8H6QRD1_9EURO|nr:hypothetical protein CNMCM7691_006626 [Aspergillus felis]
MGFLLPFKLIKWSVDECLGTPHLWAAQLPKPVHPAHRLKKSIQVERRLQEDDAAAFGLEVETVQPPLIPRKEDLAVGFGGFVNSAAASRRCPSYLRPDGHVSDADGVQEHLGYPHHHWPMHEYEEPCSLPAGGDS